MTSLWKSFVEAIAPPKHGEQAQGEGVTLNRMVGGQQLSHHELRSSHARESGSRAPLECREVQTDLNVDPAREDWNVRVEGSNGNSDVEFQDSREVIHCRNLSRFHWSAPRSVPTTSMTNVASSSTKLDNHHTSQCIWVWRISADSRLRYQHRMQLVQRILLRTPISTRMLHSWLPGCLRNSPHTAGRVATPVHPAGSIGGGGIWSSQSCGSWVLSKTSGVHCHLATTSGKLTFSSAIDQAMSQYQLQLRSAKSSLQHKDQEYHHSIQKLQDQVWSLRAFAGRSGYSAYCGHILQ